jgi:hypothetical protein
MDNKTILPQYDEFWTAEFETLQNSRHVYEVIQVSSEDQSEFHQIHPWDFLHLSKKNCRWTDCAQQCNANEEPFAFSMYVTPSRRTLAALEKPRMKMPRVIAVPRGMLKFKM